MAAVVSRDLVVHAILNVGIAAAVFNPGPCSQVREGSSMSLEQLAQCEKKTGGPMLIQVHATSSKDGRSRDAPAYEYAEGEWNDEGSCGDGWERVIDKQECKTYSEDRGKTFPEGGVNCYEMKSQGCFNNTLWIYFNNCNYTSTATHHRPICRRQKVESSNASENAKANTTTVVVTTTTAAPKATANVSANVSTTNETEASSVGEHIATDSHAKAYCINVTSGTVAPVNGFITTATGIPAELKANSAASDDGIYCIEEYDGYVATGVGVCSNEAKQPVQYCLKSLSGNHSQCKAQCDGMEKCVAFNPNSFNKGCAVFFDGEWDGGDWADAGCFANGDEHKPPITGHVESVAGATFTGACFKKSASKPEDAAAASGHAEDVLWKMMDADGDGKISHEEFVNSFGDHLANR